MRWVPALVTGLAVAVTASGALAAEIVICSDRPAFLGASSDAVEIAAQCAFTAAESGSLLILASTGVNEVDGWYTVRLRLSLNQPAGPGLVGSTRVVDVSEGVLTHQTSQASVAVPVAAGSHTVYYLADRMVGDGTVQLYRPRLMAVFVPSSDPNVRLSGVFTNGSWTTTTSTLGQVLHCSLAGLGMGSALVVADGHLPLADVAAEGHFGLGVNSTSVLEQGSERWLDVAGDLLYDGTDTGFATSRLELLGPGSYTFSLLAARSGGGGTVETVEPALNALWVPAGGPVFGAGTTLSAPWTSTIPTPQTILQTSLNPAEDGFAVIVASGHVGQVDEGYVGHFMARIDLGDDIANRYVAVDGLDRNLALTSVEAVTAGVHTVRLQGYPVSNPPGATLAMADASLAVLFVPRRLATVWSDGFETGWWDRWSTKVP